MAFVDELLLNIRSGKGGDGVVRFRHEKNREYMGPSGGDGGKGGSVYIRGVKNLSLLEKYRFTKDFEAEDGKPGDKKSLHGRRGEDLTIDLPVGSIVKNDDTGERFEILNEGDKFMILKGGDGGFGNEHFKSSTNQAPERSLPGRPGETGVFEIELQLIADAGFIGFPSVGKSTLLNTLTNASAKTAEYHFTTLEPNLGAFFEFILADVPGLISGAATGKGLGHKFLRHIRRTKTLVHCIAAADEDVVSSYNVIRKELGDFDIKLLDKEELIVLSKIDEVEEKEVKEKVKLLEKETGKKVVTMTILDDDNIKEFSDYLVSKLRG
jgi:GTP-binding protein